MKHAPARPALALLRPRLLDRLRQLLPPPAVAVWLGAGAGMGKSTLARQWLGEGPAAFWLRLDAGIDAAGALQAVQGLAAPHVKPALWREQLATPATALRAAWRAAWAALPAGSRLVLDELHAAGDDDALASWLITALEECPPGLQLLLCSRRPPPPALARLQLAGRVTRLPARELAFSDEELQAWRPGATTRWPAALSAAVPEDERPALLAQVLQHEVLNAMSAAERQLLVRLAWFPGAVDATAACALGADPEAPQQLEALAERGLLVDSVPGGWALHDLLAEALRTDSDAGPWQATVDWLQARGAPDQALAVALRACRGPVTFTAAPAVATRLLVTVAPQWLARCRHRALAEACQAVPVAARTAPLWAALASALAAFDPRAGREAALQALARADDGQVALKRAALTQVIASYFQTFDRTEPLTPWLDALQALPGTPDDATALAAFSALFLREPAHPALPRWQAAVRALPANAPCPNLRLRATMLLAKQAWYTAEHAALPLLALQARAALEDEATSPYSVLLWGLARQYQAWAQADVTLGREAGAAALAHAQAQGLHMLDRHLRLHDACFALMAGETAAARAQLAAASAGADAGRRMEAWHLFSVQAWVALEDGRTAEARAAARLAVEAGAAMGPAPQAMSWWIAGQVALAEGEPPTEALAALRAIAAPGVNPRARLAAQWLQAAAALQAGDEPTAAEAVSCALGAMQAAGGGLWFGLHRAGAASLAAWALENGMQRAAALQLVHQHRLVAPAGTGATWPWPVRLQRGEPLQIEVDGAPLVMSAKQPRRPLDLLQLLLDLGGQAPVNALADRLWPEAEGDRAMAAFEVALRRLRTLLGHAQALRLSGGVLALDRQLVWVQNAARARGLPPRVEISSLHP